RHFGDFDLPANNVGVATEEFVPKTVAQYHWPAALRPAAHIVVRGDQASAIGLYTEQIEGVAANGRGKITANGSLGVPHQNLVAVPGGEIAERRLSLAESLQHAIRQERAVPVPGRVDWPGHR